METKLGKEIFEFMDSHTNIKDAIELAEKKYCTILKLPKPPVKPFLNDENDFEEVKDYYNQFKEYNKLRLEYKELMLNIESKICDAKSSIKNYIEKRAFYHLVPEEYKHNVYSKAYYKSKSLYEFYCELDNLTDIFDI